MSVGVPEATNEMVLLGRIVFGAAARSVTLLTVTV